MDKFYQNTRECRFVFQKYNEFASSLGNSNHELLYAIFIYCQINVSLCNHGAQVQLMQRKFNLCIRLDLREYFQEINGLMDQNLCDFSKHVGGVGTFCDRNVSPLCKFPTKLIELRRSIISDTENNGHKQNNTKSMPSQHHCRIQISTDQSSIIQSK
jgi:hypothetical protein